MKLTVIIPAYNEAASIAEVIRRVLVTRVAEEILVVDDGSTDGTAEILSRMQIAHASVMRVLRHAQNRGKGAAIRTGLVVATGDLVLVQDADLEYEPAEYPVLLAPFSDPAVQVVYGSRNLRHNPHSNFAFYWGGRFLSWVANCLYGSRITDEATGYKVIRTGLLRELRLESEGFEFCAEVTAKLLRRGVRIREVPISYRPRSRAQGKKIRWYDGLVAVWTLVRLRLK
jgi:glycosyltransferase involved in cell wall biosynthesis